MKSESGPKPAPEGPGANQNARWHPSAAGDTAVQLAFDVAGDGEQCPHAGVQPDPGFFAEAMSGKVRPGVREPSVSHYMCDCCRWTA